MKRVLLSLIIVCILVLGTFKLTTAYFSDKEMSSNNILQAGSVDLKIDNTSYYNHVLSQNTSWFMDNLTNKLFFNFNDLKPGDIGEDTISIHVEDNNAWACMQINLTKNSDNTCTEPEILADPNCNSPGENQGELAQNLNFVFWVDDGDNVLEDNENVFREGNASTLFNNSKWILADSTNNLFETSGSLLGTKTYYIGKAFCFGQITKSPLIQDGVSDVRNPANTTGGLNCDGTNLNNETQTDLVNGDISFEVEQSRNNPNFKCNPVSPSPTPVACTTSWANIVESSSQGKRKDGASVLAARSNPTAGLISQSTGQSFDSPIVESNFFSLGFPFGATPAGTITVKFNSPFVNTTGADLKIYEVTGGPPYPDEKVQVEVSPDNLTFTNLGIFTKDAPIEMIIPSAQYVRLTEASNVSSFETTADGYDLDGVQALCATGL